jgi:hypothetical protein
VLAMHGEHVGEVVTFATEAQARQALGPDLCAPETFEWVRQFMDDGNSLRAVHRGPRRHALKNYRLPRTVATQATGATQSGRFSVNASLPRLIPACFSDGSRLILFWLLDGSFVPYACFAAPLRLCLRLLCATVEPQTCWAMIQDVFCDRIGASTVTTRIVFRGRSLPLKSHTPYASALGTCKNPANP